MGARQGAGHPKNVPLKNFSHKQECYSICFDGANSSNNLLEKKMCEQQNDLVKMTFIYLSIAPPVSDITDISRYISYNQYHDKIS